jgi:hypothetical protein
VDDVVLGDVAELLAEAVVVVVEAGAVEEDAAGGGLGVAVEGFEESGFAGSGGAHEGDQLGGEDGHRDGLDEAVAVGGVDDDAGGLDGEVAVVFALGEFAAFEELKAVAAEADLLAGLGEDFAADADAGDEGAVAGAEVFDEDAVGVAGEAGVVPGDHGKFEREIATGIAPDHHGVLALEGDFVEGGFADFDLFAGKELGGGDFVGAEEDFAAGSSGARVMRLSTRSMEVPLRAFRLLRAWRGMVPADRSFDDDAGVVPAYGGDVDLDVGQGFFP